MYTIVCARSAFLFRNIAGVCVCVFLRSGRRLLVLLLPLHIVEESDSSVCVCVCVAWTAAGRTCSSNLNIIPSTTHR